MQRRIRTDRSASSARNGKTSIGVYKLLKDTARAVGGALVFSLPMLMTMEMWSLGFTIDRLRLALLMVLAVPLLTELSHQIGYEHTVRRTDDLMDAMFAIGVGGATALILLICFGVVHHAMPPEEAIGKVAIQTVPAAMGALLARSQFGSRSEDKIVEKKETYPGEMFLMGIGALFLGFNVAPTEEIVLIAYRMTPWHALAVVALSLFVMHGFVFALGFRGGAELGPDTPWWSALVRFTLPGYVLALLISLYVLWTFERTEGAAFSQILLTAIVLGLPSSVGAAAARLIL
ncbi:TIGR02587 family membrane protein [Nitratireductor sp. ZSWI3]|uniref:TIGR02587 family membrane protein n=1 Tax=Nitratireductor sp. ZSWI3 TaxID=2966359 RepID=UPI00214FC187|nr:TIGR02587 family membrane protein [Nitratireductor sp. ZSWI3]MCR4264670.1 TIGR02587 family membrane protein [Nitratireductor sp. ZSWI3]